jgi:hypothetical protein
MHTQKLQENIQIYISSSYKMHLTLHKRECGCIHAKKIGQELIKTIPTAWISSITIKLEGIVACRDPSLGNGSEINNEITPATRQKILNKQLYAAVIE